ncbi:MAG: SoxR reducing system RseC family protein [Pelovirga sp.]
MIEETGTVIDLRDGGRIALVQCRKQSACDRCPTAGMCNTGGGLRQVEALNRAMACVDDQVKLVISSRVFLRSSLILYLVPLVGLLIGAGSGYQLDRVTAWPIDPELLIALCAVGGLVIVFLLIYRLTRRLDREAFMPIIVSAEPRKR